MKIMAKLAALGLLMFTLFPAVAAHAEDCAVDDYCTPSTPNNGAVDANEDPVVAPADAEVTPAAEEAPVSEPAAAETSAPSGSLPITGGDVIGIAALGAVAVGLGTLLVRRSGSMRAARVE